MKLGKKPARHDPRTVRLATFVGDLPPAPSEVDFLHAKRLSMMLNDRIGDCGLAAPAHVIQCQTAENGVEFVPSDAAVEKAYSDVSGYVPGDDMTDTGVVLLDAMNYWRRVGIDGHRIEAFVAADLKNREHFKLGIYLAGGMVLGFELPASAQDSPEWHLLLGGSHGSPEPGSWGGHAVSAHKYDEHGVWVVTWGAPLFLSWDFLDAYCDEAFVPFSEDWADWDGAPNGFPTADLRRMIAEVAA